MISELAGGLAPLRPILLAALAAAALVAGPARAEPGCDHELTRSDARYANGDVALAATLVMPRAPAPVPAVVLLQGSGTSGRSNAWAGLIAETLARCGVAVLFTDKRGSGESGGEWRTASMLDLAGDGAAGFRWLAAQPGVDRRRLGYLGLSQGGQVAPAAARLTPAAAFAVGWVSGVGPMKQALLYELEQTYRQYGLAAEQIAPLQDMARASFDWLETGRGWEGYLARRTAIAAGPYALAAQSWPAAQDDAYWTFWRKNGAYDALPYWRDLVDRRGKAALVVLGAEDARDNVDVPSVSQALRTGVKGRMKVEVLPGVGHSLQVAPGQLHPRAIELTLALARDPAGWLRERPGD